METVYMYVTDIYVGLRSLVSGLWVRMLKSGKHSNMTTILSNFPGVLQNVSSG